MISSSFSMVWSLEAPPLFFWRSNFSPSRVQRLVTPTVQKLRWDGLLVPVRSLSPLHRPRTLRDHDTDEDFDGPVADVLDAAMVSWM